MSGVRFPSDGNSTDSPLSPTLSWDRSELDSEPDDNTGPIRRLRLGGGAGERERADIWESGVGGSSSFSSRLCLRFPSLRNGHTCPPLNGIRFISNSEHLLHFRGRPFLGSRNAHVGAWRPGGTGASPSAASCGTS